MPKIAAARFKLALSFVLLALASTGAGAQPFVTWMTLSGPTHGYLQIPHHSDFDITDDFTFEAWVNFASPSPDCDSIAGKGFTETWWVGRCDETLRAYLKGSSSSFDAGTIPQGVWTHIAVTWDGATQRHYVDGELLGSVARSAPLPSNNEPIRIGSDVDFEHTPNGSIDEVRLWNVARSTSEIRSTINLPIAAAQVGLVSVWSLDGTPNDVVGGHHGAVGGSGVGALTFPVALGCTGNAQTLCVLDRFAISSTWQDFLDNTGPGSVVPFQTSESGLFTFFNPENWEIQIKVLNACSLNNRYWVFAAATTNLHFRVVVFDREGGRQKIYFNYRAQPAVAVTDTDAFATCP